MKLLKARIIFGNSLFLACIPLSSKDVKRITGMSLIVVPIHKYPEYLKECCNLINREWKRSETARLHSLQNSSDNLPTSLILLEDKRLIGHLKLSIIPSIRNACFIESVVIDPNLRGKGYGKVLMKEAEDYVKNILNLDTIYLSTKGQEKFYEKLGYNECLPISIYGSFVPKDILKPNKFTKYESDNVPPPPPLPRLKDFVISKTYLKKELVNRFTSSLCLP